VQRLGESPIGGSDTSSGPRGGLVESEDVVDESGSIEVAHVVVSL
jgi:hypothetical protein